MMAARRELRELLRQPKATLRGLKREDPKEASELRLRNNDLPSQTGWSMCRLRSARLQRINDEKADDQSCN